jgi:hypothetical protein
LHFGALDIVEGSASLSCKEGVVEIVFGGAGCVLSVAVRGAIGDFFFFFVLLMFRAGSVLGIFFFFFFFWKLYLGRIS